MPRRTKRQKAKEKQLEFFGRFTLASLVKWAEEQGLPLEDVTFRVEYTYYDAFEIYATNENAL